MHPTFFSHFREDPRDPHPIDHDPERNFGFRLTLRESEDTLVLHGQLVGIGRDGRSAGNYSGEHWLIQHGPENGGPTRVDYWKSAEDGYPSEPRERIIPATGQAQFDSESGEFFCFVSDVRTAEQIVTALKRYMDTVETTYGAAAMEF